MKPPRGYTTLSACRCGREVLVDVDPEGQTHGAEHRAVSLIVEATERLAGRRSYELVPIDQNGRSALIPRSVAAIRLDLERLSPRPRSIHLDHECETP